MRGRSRDPERPLAAQAEHGLDPKRGFRRQRQIALFAAARPCRNVADEQPLDGPTREQRLQPGFELRQLLWLDQRLDLDHAATTRQPHCRGTGDAE